MNKRSIRIIVLFGLVGLGSSCLKYLIENGYKVDLVITEKYNTNEEIEKVLHSTYPMQYYSLQEYKKYNTIVPTCEKYNIPYITEINDWDIVYKKIKNINPEIILVSTFDKIIPKKIINLGRLSINIHPSLLPKYRGPSPVEWLIKNNEKEAGLTIHKLTEKLDSGDIIISKKIEVLQNDNTASLYEKFNSFLISDLLEEFFNLYKSNKIYFTKQNEAIATEFPYYKNEYSLLDFVNETAEKIHNKIRAGNFYKPAYFVYNRIEIIVWKSNIINENHKDIPVGDAFSVSENNGLIIQTKDKCIELLELQINVLGSVKINGMDFLGIIK